MLLTVAIVKFTAPSQAINKQEHQADTHSEVEAIAVPQPNEERPVEAEKPKQEAKPVEVPPAPAPATYPTDCETYRPIIAKYSWNVDVAMNVMRVESGCNPNAANYGDNHGVCIGSFGLFQISCHGGQIFNPEQNIAAAWAKYQARGWQPWSATTCKKIACY